MIYFFLFLGLILSASGPCLGDALDDDVFGRKLQFLEERYRDYFLHNKKNLEFEESLKKGVSQYKREEKGSEIEMEKARVLYQKSSKIDLYDSPELEAAWEKEQVAQDKLFEKDRVLYIKRRKRLEKIEATAKMIPQEAEVGLESIEKE